jgi:NADH-quinone oxidoreductase subunit F
VQKPGYYEVEVGKVTMGEVINDLCGGLKPGRKFKAIIPGGSSAKVLRADERFKLKDGREIGIMDIPMDFDTMAACGTMAGSGGVIIMDDSRSMTWVINNLNNFYAHESCGQCTPCREGSLWMKKISDRIVAGKASPDDVGHPGIRRQPDRRQDHLRLRRSLLLAHPELHQEIPRRTVGAVGGFSSGARSVE